MGISLWFECTVIVCYWDPVVAVVPLQLLAMKLVKRNSSVARMNVHPRLQGLTHNRRTSLGWHPPRGPRNGGGPARCATGNAELGPNPGGGFLYGAEHGDVGSINPPRGAGGAI